MLTIALAVLQYLAFWSLACILVGAEYLDWYGRLDVLREKHRKVYRFINNRTLRLVLLVLVFGMLATELRSGLEYLHSEPLVVNLVVPTADAGAKNADIVRLQQKVDALTQSEPAASLRHRTMKLADEFYKFQRGRFESHPPYAYPNSSDPNPSDERKKAISICQKYDQETMDQYNRLYRDRFVGIIREYHAKGVPVGWLENSVAGGSIGWIPPGSSWEDSPQDNLGQFRNLAYRVDGQDNLIVLGY